MKQALVGIAGNDGALRRPYIAAQQTGSANSSTVVPTLVKYSGAITDINGKLLNSTLGLNFLLYKDEQGGTPLWMETQNAYQMIFVPF
jgi:hypothetical protein